MIPIKRKIELALRHYLASRPDLGAIPVLAGHRAEKRELPCIIVYGESSSESAELPPGTGVFDVRIKVFILTQADDEDIETHDERVETVKSALYNADVVRTALNVPQPVPDPRVVKDLHVYDIIETEADEGRDERHFGEVLTYSVTCQAADGPE